MVHVSPLEEAALIIARTILEGFDKHYRIFRQISAGAKERFERGAWGEVQQTSRERIGFYDQRVTEAVHMLLSRFPEAKHERMWPHVKQAYISLLEGHKQPECAETFYNSAACRVLDRTYYRNEYIFWKPAISTEHLQAGSPMVRFYFPAATGLLRTLEKLILRFGLECPWEDLRRDLRYIAKEIRERFPGPRRLNPDFQIQVLSSLFFRNRAAYVIGRAIDHDTVHPFAVPIRRSEKGELYVDALLLSREDVGRLFSLARAYFMVDMEVPAAYVSFLRSLMPSKPPAELYTSVGLQKQGKTLFYRELDEHLRSSKDPFVLAPGTRGMVMLVFTLPSFPYVFKVIRDWFEPPKETSARAVKEKYLLVKYHDRVGRMADTLEYSDVAFPLDRFEPDLVEELKRLCPSQVSIEGAQLIVKHLYIERRMVPLDIWLSSADEKQKRQVIAEYGRAIKELAAADIFPGDLLLKNFGVTRWGRVVFYDYDEICRLTEVNFRRFPTPRDDADEMASEPWYGVGQNDVFPEQFANFLFRAGRERELFLELHGDLLDPDYWIRKQGLVRSGEMEEFFPYPEERRFAVKYRGAAPMYSLAPAVEQKAG
jgi:isocitrate dehydrogenase kinase/phosphatase